MTDEGLEEWVVTELWMSGSPTPNTFVDVTDKLPLKLAALRAHVSQTEHMEDLEGMIRGWMTQTAERGGLPEGRLAEMFHAVTPGLSRVRAFRPVRPAGLLWRP